MHTKKIRHNIKQFTTENRVIRGTIILTITGFATRIIGFYNRIFLTHLIGAKELGIYQLIFPLYMVAFSLTTFGNELALTKLVSEYRIHNDYSSQKKCFKICLMINVALGTFTSIIMFKHANWLCTNVLNAPACTNCLKTISLGIPFMSAKGAIHGYFLGLEQSGVHGISDFLEQLAKVFGLYVIVTFFCIRNSYDAAFAVWGIVIGEFTAFTFSVLAICIHFKNNRKTNTSNTNTLTYFRRFLRDSIPFTTNRLALTLLQSIEAILIPTVLLRYNHNSTWSLSTYGIFTGMAFPFIMFPSTVTNSLSTMLLPAVSSANSLLLHDYMQKLCEKSLHFCLLIGLFSMTTFYIFGPDIGVLIFDSPDAGQYLLQLSFLCPFIYLATTLSSILNGLGHATHNLLLTIFATVIRISFILISIPKIGIKGYIIGLFVSYLFLTFSCMHKLQKEVNLSIHFIKSILFPVTTFIFTGSAAFIGYKKLLTFSSFHRHPLFLILIILLLYLLLVFCPILFFDLKKDAHLSEHP